MCVNKWFLCYSVTNGLFVEMFKYDKCFSSGFRISFLVLVLINAQTVLALRGESLVGKGNQGIECLRQWEKSGKGNSWQDLVNVAIEGQQSALECLISRSLFQSWGAEVRAMRREDRQVRVLPREFRINFTIFHCRLDNGYFDINVSNAQFSDSITNMER